MYCPIYQILDEVLLLFISVLLTAHIFEENKSLFCLYKMVNFLWFWQVSDHHTKKRIVHCRATFLRQI